MSRVVDIMAWRLEVPLGGWVGPRRQAYDRFARFPEVNNAAIIGSKYHIELKLIQPRTTSRNLVGLT